MLPAQLRAQFTGISLGLPVHDRNGVLRSQIRIRIPVALQTPTHVQGRVLLHYFHAVDTTVATDTTDAELDMTGMIEVNEIRQIVNPDPLQRNSGLLPGTTDCPFGPAASASPASRAA